MHHLRPTVVRSSRGRVSLTAVLSTALAVGLLAAVAVMMSRSFDYPTDRVNTIAGGVNERDNSVSSLGIRVLAASEGEGRLIGALSNRLEDSAELTAVTGEGITAVIEEPVTVEGRGRVNLVDAGMIGISGDFTAGEHVDLTLVYSTGETAELSVPVVKPCFQYADVPVLPNGFFDSSAEGDAKAEKTDGEAAKAAANEEHSDEEHGDATFLCADEIPTPGADAAH